LIALAEEMKALGDQALEAVRRCMETNDLYETMRPTVPVALLWRTGDPIGCVIWNRNGNETRVCDPRKVETLKRGEFAPWTYLGTDEEWRHRCDTHGFVGEYLPGEEALWLDRRPRAAEIVVAHDAYQSAVETAAIASGYEEAEEHLAAIHKTERKVFEKMMDLVPTTLGGYRALAYARSRQLLVGDHR
jgi:hypothetical protein